MSWPFSDAMTTDTLYAPRVGKVKVTLSPPLCTARPTDTGTALVLDPLAFTVTSNRIFFSSAPSTPFFPRMTNDASLPTVARMLPAPSTYTDLARSKEVARSRSLFPSRDRSQFCAPRMASNLASSSTVSHVGFGSVGSSRTYLLSPSTCIIFSLTLRHDSRRSTTSLSKGKAASPVTGPREPLLLDDEPTSPVPMVTTQSMSGKLYRVLASVTAISAGLFVYTAPSMSGDPSWPTPGAVHLGALKQARTASDRGRSGSTRGLSR
mmetsp:Transcript_5855/g.19101  ORF Transcript_5855/g.19101 Transcript_5855/m.19101 type:complete len:265 (-) Transcript_5855:507-1301(-)